MREDPLLPLFVYGSLRPGQLYHRLARYGLAAVRPARLDGARMYDAGDYPYVVLGDGTVHGDLLDFAPAVRPAVLAALDRLEGYVGPGHPDNDYDRLSRTAVTADGEAVTALVYVAAPGRVDAVRALPPVPGGDWVAHLAARA